MPINIPSKIYDLINTNLTKDILFICPNEEEALNYSKLAHFLKPLTKTYFFPKWDTIAYDRVSPSKQILADRAKILSKLSSRSANEFAIIFISAANLVHKVPSPKIFKNKHLEVKSNSQIKQSTIVNFLVASGFIRVSTATEPGEFALRGDIMDIVISEDESYRLNFDWEQNLTIKMLDPISQISSEKIEKFEIYPSSEMLFSSETIEHFKNSFLTTFGPNHSRNTIYLNLCEGRQIIGSEHLLPLFYDDMVNFKSYLINPEIINAGMTYNYVEDEIDQIKDFYQSRIETNRINPTEFYPALKPEMLYDINFKLPACNENNNIDDNSALCDLNFYAQSSKLQHPVGDIFSDFVKTNQKARFVICCSSKSGEQKISQILRLSDIETYELDYLRDAKPGRVATTILQVTSSFHTNKKDLFIIKQQDLIGLRRISNNITSSKKLKNILSELETLTEGELVVHREHGIGRFEGVKTIDAAGIRHDCIKIVYDGGDLIYIPVENLEDIKKYGHEDAALDKLGGVSWQKRKARLKNRIGETAIKLMKIAAERKVIECTPLIKDERYDEFCNAFAYTETDDQLTAISDIENDLVSGHPMDRLICGDVGFGKTEVAMRAAFIAASNEKQVAVIAPTTILAKQHFTSFRERFARFGINISQLSRLTPKNQIREVKENIKNGIANIIIGTHALLANDIKFSNLGMIIIDEEQHFGVLQKEKLKELKHGTHVISLSATPIPRTLQMSMLGIRDLSLIATPPIDRLPVRTNVIPYDAVLVRDALLREHARGGRSFYVVPRIADLEEVEKSLTALVPELKYAVAHGKMSPSSINEIMEDFYDGKYDILLSTTIIESGIDIPAANTIIIHKAEMLGLSQLYQLRGRVGRSKLRGFAYLIVANSKSLTQHALRRLDIMQNIDSLGAGFTIASYDSDIRGFGNLVGDEQSGHIKEVGAELYQEMLEEAINAIEHNKAPEETFITNINLGIPVFIPEEYVLDSDQRLALYKRISLLSTEDEIENFHDELIDRFGPISTPVNNLLHLIKIKLLCKKLGISDVDVGPNGMLVRFAQPEKAADMVMKYISKYPRITKIRPDNRLAIIGQKIDVYSMISAFTQLF